MKKQKTVRAGPTKAEVMAELDALILKISELREQCHDGGEHGPVQLAHAHESALRLRDLVEELPEKSGMFLLIVESLPVLVGVCLKVHSLLSFLFFCWGLNNENRRNYQVSAPFRGTFTKGIV